MAPQQTILVIDDHETTRETMVEIIGEMGFHVIPAENQAKALAELKAQAPDLVLTDLKLPDGSGMEILSQCKSLYPSTPVVMITGHGSLERAVEAARLGAYEYLTKPLDKNKLKVIVNNALHLVELERQVERANAIDAIVGQSPALKAVKDLVRQIAHTDATVLIEGESGTGKELVANAIQSLSLRDQAPFVKVNIAALSPELVESELFGHEKGAFSGAIRQRKGRFEMAQRGTLFLDEIGEMPLPLQVKLLRVLQENEFERVGGMETIRADIRLLVATNCDLRAKMEAGEFREDLFYRINVVRIEVPPLRERREDIPLLAAHFLRRFGSRYGVEKSFTDEAMEKLKAYDWPGNVREMENAIESAVVRTPETTLSAALLPEEIAGAAASGCRKQAFPPGLTLDEVEKRYIFAELERLEGNKTQAAKSLGIGLKTLYRKLDAYDKVKADG